MVQVRARHYYGRDCLCYVYVHAYTLAVDGVSANDAGDSRPASAICVFQSSVFCVYVYDSHTYTRSDART